jgi:hypothetical protein
LIQRSVGWLLLLAGGAALPLLWMYPLLGDAGARILGPEGDNLTNVWNCWWMRYALGSSSADFFYCPLIFVPWGTSLVLHTHTALPAFVAATLLAPLPVVAAQNVVIWAGLAGNAAAMFVLARRTTRDTYASTAAALTFAVSPFVTTHLLGHWNLIHLWPLPLIALVFPRALDAPPRWRFAVLSGAVLTASVYTDYYVAVYACVLVVGIAADRLLAVAASIRPSVRRSPVILFGVLAAMSFLAAAVITATGGLDTNVGGVHVSARTSTNPLRLGWIAVLLALFSALRPRLRIRVRSERPSIVMRALAITATTVVAGALPLLPHVGRLLSSGDYAAPSYTWRSGPRGIDLLTIVLGHPYHLLWGGHVRGTYDSLELDPIEQVGWIGFVPILLSIYAVRRAPASAARWAVLAGAAFVWTLGPFLRIAGVDTGLPLPQVFQQFIPLLSNARIPGRAMALVILSVAMLVGIGTCEWRKQRRAHSRALVGAGVCLAILMELWPATHPTLHLRVPGIYSSLSSLEPGALLEVPLGVRDGFGELGRLDHEALFHQTAHQRPMFGGFVARLSPRLRARYATEPILSSLLKLSSGESISPAAIDRDKAVSAARLREWEVSVIVVRKEGASPELIRYVRDVLGARPIAQDETRELYAVPVNDSGH